jgi:hypothetical protein
LLLRFLTSGAPCSPPLAAVAPLRLMLLMMVMLVVVSLVTYEVGRRAGRKFHPRQRSRKR